MEHIGSTEYLVLIAKHGYYVLFEQAGRLKNEVISLTDIAGRPVPIPVRDITYCPLLMPRKIFDDLLGPVFI